MTTTLDYQHIPFPMIHGVPVGLICYHSILGVIIGSCPDRDRFYLKYIIPRTLCSKIKGWENKLRRAYVLQIYNTPVFTLSDNEDSISASL